MKSINLILLFLFLSFCPNSFGQREASNWYFGDNAGIRFNPDDTVSELKDGKLSTIEGCATISDENGELIFYTDGITLWDREHKPMPDANGNTGEILYGNPSSTQSAIIIPKPNDGSVFYVFTVDTSTPSDRDDKGFNYSVVDISLNESFGEVISKNINLLNKSSEKISAVIKDCSTQSLWVITLASLDGKSNSFDTFHAYEITENGINTKPVSSQFSNFNIEDGRGYLKFSPDGKKLACANTTYGLYIFDFDVTTGKVSNKTSINVNLSPTNKPQEPYGAEFSQNSNVLYVTTYFNPQNRRDLENRNVQYGALLQYDLTATDISSSEIVLQESVQYRGGLQLGPDGRIYRSMNVTHFGGSPYLSVINTPNALGTACDYKHKKIKLEKPSRQGLPPFITSFFAQKIDLIGNNSESTRLQLCKGDKYTLKATEVPGAKYTWTLNGNPLAESDFDLEINKSGIYEVFVDANTVGCNNSFEGIATVTVVPRTTAYNALLTQCDEDSTIGGITRFNLNEAYNDLTGGVSGLTIKFYKDSARTDEIVKSDSYPYNSDTPNPIYVSVINEKAGCSDDSILTLNLSFDVVDVFTYRSCDEINSEDGINNFSLKDVTQAIQEANGFKFSISYYRTYDDALSENVGFTDIYSNSINPYTDSLFARIENNNDCFAITKVFFEIEKLPKVEVEDSFKYCIDSNKKITITAGALEEPTDNYTYLWSNGTTDYSTEVNASGIYTVNIFNTNGCSNLRTITVEASNKATFSSPPYKIDKNNKHNSITVFAIGEGNYEYALYDKENSNQLKPYQISDTFENIPPNIYTIRVKDTKNNCGTVNTALSIIGFPKFFTPNNDGKNDTWQVYGVSGMFQPNTKILIYNRYGEIIKKINPLGSGWNGLCNGQMLPADDYWFVVTLEDGRVFKDHFTLKH